MELQDPCLISLLGGLRVTHGGADQTLPPRRKVEALLAYLALYRERTHPRDVLIELFWPDREIASGRDNLSTTLSAVRRLLEPPGIRPGSILLATHHQVSLAASAVTTDVAEFERRLDQVEHTGATAERAALLERAVTLYRGDLLPGVYDDWAVREGERLQSRYVKALREWSQELERLGDDPGALRAAQQAVSAEPFAEEEQARVLTLLVRTGRPAAAREAYRAMERLWHEEFGASPSSETRRLVESLLTENRDASTERRHLSSAGVSAGPRPARRASTPLDRFFGRETELADLAAWWTDPTQRLLTLTGLGGMGKTRLAIEFARQAAGSEATPWHFVSLADTSDPAQMLTTIAQALPLPPGSGLPLDRIAAYFGDQDKAGLTRPLLILDNLEQMLGDDQAATTGSAVAELLEAVPGLRCLGTSRHPLGLRGERLFPLNPLPVPPDSAGAGEAADESILLAWPSVALYADRARAIRPDFRITPNSAGAVAGLCRLLEGSPLAIELAASWVRVLPPRAMWERLTRGAGLGDLETRYADVPARQRSLRAALDWSWRLLRPDDQALLARLSVFRGGWSAEAAESVCGEPQALKLLAHLEAASLVRADETADGGTRWRFLETVRQYAQARQEEFSAGQELPNRHADFFGAVADEATAQADGPEQARWFNRLEAEHDNLRAALDFSLGAEDGRPGAAERGLRTAAALLPFWRARGHLREGSERYARLLAGPHAANPTSSRAASLNGLGILAMLQSDYATANASHREAAEICRSIGDRSGEATALHGLGDATFYSQDYVTARGFYEAGLALREEVGDEAGIASSCHSLGNLAMREERPEEAAAFFERALGLRRRAGDALGVAGTLGAFSQLRFAQGDWEAAAAATRESLRLFDRAGQRWIAALSLDLLSRIASAQGRPGRETRLLAAAHAVRERFNFRVPPAERDTQEGRLTSLRTRLGEASFQSAWEAGQAMTWDEAVEYALAETE